MKGFSLIEVLITLFILSLGLLGILTLQTVALRRNYDAYLYSIAVTRIASMFDRLQTGSVTRELSFWNQTNIALLPQGEGRYHGGQEISVCWFSRVANAHKCLTNNDKN